MSIVETITENLPYGKEIIGKLFELDSKSIRTKLKEICGERLANYQHLFDDGEVEKIIKNDEPFCISLSYFDQIVIDALGIAFRKEHSYKSDMLVWFDKNFKLD
jgi:hypothetical protein